MTTNTPPKPPRDPKRVASSQDTVERLLDTSGRTGRRVPIRNAFVQRHGSPDVEPGPLADLIRRRDQRALLLYLLILARASSAPWDVSQPAAVWARALNIAAESSGRAAVSKAIGRLEGLQLIRRERERRRAKLYPLREDGSGEAYEHPGDPTQGHGYFQLPFAFWTERWHEKLDLPAIAMLLILLSLPDDPRLPVDQVPQWYGVSRATAERGLIQLRGEGLVSSHWIQHPDPLAPEGFRWDLHHQLHSPFDARSLRSDAKSEPPADAKPTASQRRRQRRRRQGAAVPTEQGGADGSTPAMNPPTTNQR